MRCQGGCGRSYVASTVPDQRTVAVWCERCWIHVNGPPAEGFTGFAADGAHRIIERCEHEWRPKEVRIRLDSRTLAYKDIQRKWECVLCGAITSTPPADQARLTAPPCPEMHPPQRKLTAGQPPADASS